jgi:voltage-gated potassium channel
VPGDIRGGGVMARQRSRLQTWRQTLHHYYESNARDAHRFRYALLAFDLFTVLFIVVTSFLPRGPVIE